MRWNKGNDRMSVLRIPGTLEIKATVTAHAETIVAEIKVAHETVRKWTTPAEKGVAAVKHEVEEILTGMAQGIWEG